MAARPFPQTTSEAWSGRSWTAVDSSPPPFSDEDMLSPEAMIELGPMPTTPASESDSFLPAYEDVLGDGDPPGGTFVPTLELQIQTPGKALYSLPSPTRPDPIPVHVVSPTGQLGDVRYISVRHTRGSGNCVLVRADDPAETPLCSTIYRFGPGRPPVVTLHTGDAGPAVDSSSSSAAPPPPPEDGWLDVSFEITSSRAVVSRAQTLRTPFGTFEWRYAARRDRVAEGADSLLVMERLVTVATAGGGKEVQRTRVAQLVRSSDTRSPGSGRTAAGNGGRLTADLRGWADRKGEAEQMELVVVATCLVMLKKEVDRRRMHQMMAISAML